MIITLVICDMCDFEGIPGASRHTLSRLGWKVFGLGSDLDLCPRCH